ncbi:MAG TPA: response regulator [Chloroflexota bacterium]|jgi:two-component system response regulator MprA|nr:response regulator [Chloroflexota bacterium]
MNADCAAHGGTRILVVDDNPGIRELLHSALVGEGYTVTLAADGFDALECVESTMPRVVILDLMMPRMDGYGFARELEARGLRGNMRVLVLTAGRRGNTQFVDLGADAYFDKPFDIVDFLREVAVLAG